MSENLKNVAVTFEMQYSAFLGEEIVVIGQHRRLGSWDHNQGVKLTWSEGDVWRGTVSLPPDEVYNYKYVIVRNGACTWETGANRTISVDAEDADEGLAIHDAWENAEESSVVVGGVKKSQTEKISKSLKAARELSTEAMAQNRLLKAQLATKDIQLRQQMDEAKQTTENLIKTAEAGEAGIKAAQEAALVAHKESETMRYRAEAAEAENRALAQELSIVKDSAQRKESELTRLRNELQMRDQQAREAEQRIARLEQEVAVATSAITAAAAAAERSVPSTEETGSSSPEFLAYDRESYSLSTMELPPNGANKKW